MELDGFGVAMAPFGLGLAVVRGTGPKFLYRPLFGHMGPPGAQNGPFSGFWVTSGFRPVPGLLALGPLGPIGPCLGSYVGFIPYFPDQILNNLLDESLYACRLYTSPSPRD